MNLRKVAAKFETTSFDVFNETTQLWESDGFTGKVMPIDRFLSIFHRATRRRALGLSPGAIIPASNTLRDPATGQAYIMGLTREDSRNATAYDQTGILHGCDYIAEIFRSAPVGAVDDPGVLVPASVGEHYMDIELRASAENEEATGTFDGHFFLTAPAQADLEQWDFIVYQGTSYQVHTVYNDSGMTMARIVERDDPRVDIVFHHKGATSDYDPSTGTVTAGMTDYNVSGFFQGFELTDIDNDAVSSGDLQFIIKQSHIGVTPTIQDELTWEGQRYKVRSVQRDFTEEQYKLHCVI
jgi:hypothetical protein